MSNASDQRPFRLSSLTFSVYIPTILFSIGQGAVIPIIPLFAKDLGASVAAAAIIVAMRGIGQLLGDMPAGVAVSRWGDKGVMVLGTALIAIVAVGAAFSPSPAVLGALSLLMGMGWAFWQIARLAYVTEEAPIQVRGRALSMLGGMNRVGNFIGPVIGGFLGQHLGLESAFYAQAVCGIGAAAIMFILARESGGSEELGGHGLGGRLAGTIIDNRKVFLTAGPPIIILMLLRQARLIFLPLWGDEIGLDVAQIGLLTGLSFLIDAAVFYPVGAIMDTWGRKWAGVPCLATMAVGLLILPLTNDFLTFMSVAIITGVGNGFGSGINMTLGADFAPEVGRGEFLGVWRLVSDIGLAGGPLIISGLTGIGSLALASVASGGIGLAGAAMMAFLVTETLKKPQRAAVKVKT
ncbi:MAG: MFS transporter [Dehalococcoidia bacterium]|nr:MFS transporter [Dehalococcoidia bacterium]